MKPNQEEREKLARLIRARRANSALSNAELAVLAEVDPGQTSRILDGRFRTVSGNVLRICNVLGIDPHDQEGSEITPRQARKRAAWARLEASVRRVWDETPQGADRLIAVLDAVARVKPDSRVRPRDRAAPAPDRRPA